MCLFLKQILHKFFRQRVRVWWVTLQAWCVPGYNCVCLDAWLTVNRRRPQAGHHDREEQGKHRKGKVFICTTMYREVRRRLTRPPVEDKKTR